MKFILCTQNDKRYEKGKKYGKIVCNRWYRWKWKTNTIIDSKEKIDE